MTFSLNLTLTLNLTVPRLFFDEHSSDQNWSNPLLILYVVVVDFLVKSANCDSFVQRTLSEKIFPWVPLLGGVRVKERVENIKEPGILKLAPDPSNVFQVV